MSGSAPTNNAAVDFEKQQAAEADAKEAARQASLQQGQQAIDQIFNGSPVMGPQSYDWSTFKPPSTSAGAIQAQYQGGAPAAAAPGSVPAGYTAVQVAPRAATGTSGAGAGGSLNSLNPYASRYSGGAASAGGSLDSLNPYASRYSGGAASTGGGAGGSVWALKDASGKIYYQGDPLTYQGPTGKTTGGFGDDFYNNYKQQILNYYQPDERRQYDEAQRDLTYNLARAGTLQSSTAADKTGDLAYNDALQKANIVSNANQQTGQLQQQIQSNKQDLINQLYATDDPTLTANLAESSAKASQLQNPTLTPAASLFTPALSAVGSVANYATNPYGVVPPGAVGSNVTNSPAPASSSGTGAGKITYG